MCIAAFTPLFHTYIRTDSWSPHSQCCRSTYYIEIIWLFNSEYAWLLLGKTFATKATLALIKYKFDSLGLWNISPYPLISIAQGHLITVSLVLMKLIVSIENKISTVHNTAYMHIRSTTASNEAPFPTKLITLQYAYYTPKSYDNGILHIFGTFIFKWFF